MDPDAVCDGECSRSRDGCIRCVLDGGGDRLRGRGSFSGEFGRPIVTGGDFVA